MKWVLIVVAIAVGVMIYIGDMGGARDATQNYVDVRTQKSDEQGARITSYQNCPLFSN